MKQKGEAQSIQRRGDTDTFSKEGGKKQEGGRIRTYFQAAVLLSHDTQARKVAGRGSVWREFW